MSLFADAPPSRVVHTAPGRAVSYYEFGDPAGKPVFALHGTPACGATFVFLDECARAAHMRVIAPDRPGIGQSDRWAAPNYRVASYPTELAATADAIGIDEFAVLGYSGGGPYALAAADALDDRVSAVALVGCAGQVGVWAQRRDFELIDRNLTLLSTHVPTVASMTLWVSAQVAHYAPGAALWFTQIGMAQSDRDAFARFESPRAALDLFTRAFDHGARGIVADYAALAQPWGFDVTALQSSAVPIRSWHGAADDIVPLRHTQALIARVPRIDLTIWPGVGHLAFVERASEIVEWLAGRTNPMGQSDQFAC
jgi:pimeloyl-ACP methyl ester carboxylesterase